MSINTSSLLLFLIISMITVSGADYVKADFEGKQIGDAESTFFKGNVVLERFDKAPIAEVRVQARGGESLTFRIDKKGHALTS